LSASKMALPPSLKPIDQYIKQAQKLAKAAPVVSYYCKRYALEKALEVRDKSDPACNAVLGDLMQWLETNKAALGPTEDNKIEVELMALQIFKRADDEDRAGNATKNTAVAFRACSIIMEVCQTFGEMPPDLVDKHKYAKYKAVDIITALREGRKPEPGPPGGMEEEPAGEDSLGLPAVPSDPAPAPAAQPGRPVTPTQVAPASVRREVPAVAPRGYIAGGPGLPDPTIMVQAEKYAKTAISAIQFDDVPQAVSDLKKALACLGHPVR